jgi:putative intracellular protease/amidase
MYETLLIILANGEHHHRILCRKLPQRIRDRPKRIGANFVQAGLWRGFAIRDGNLITGQQNFSGEATARLLIESLGR